MVGEIAGGLVARWPGGLVARWPGALGRTFGRHGASGVVKAF